MTYTHVAAKIFYVAAGGQIIGTRLSGREAHNLAFRTHLEERGRREVRVMGHRSEKVFERFLKASGK